MPTRPPAAWGLLAAGCLLLVFLSFLATGSPPPVGAATVTPVATIPGPVTGRSPTPVASPTPAATSTPLPPTPTRRPPVPTPSPLPSPTLEPSAFFLPSFLSMIQKTAEEGEPKATLRGRVMDWRQRGIPGLPVRASTGDTSFTAVTGQQGEYEFGELPPALYEVQVEGHDGRPAKNVPLEPGIVTVLEFAEAAVPGTPTASPSAAPQGRASPPVATATALIRIEPTVSPRATIASATLSARVATPTPRLGQLERLLGIDVLAGFNLNPWIENLLVGAAGAYALLLAGLVYATLRRRG